jgi:predicted Rossmann-fold nucleotide-binding protein
MKVIIAGSRHITDRVALAKAINQSGFEIAEVVSGCAPGVDTMGEALALADGHSIRKFPADWNKHGRAAGPIRNKQMAEYADAAIILWDGKSRGTLNMIKNMSALDKPYFIRMVFDEL